MEEEDSGGGGHMEDPPSEINHNLMVVTKHDVCVSHLFISMAGNVLRSL